MIEPVTARTCPGIRKLPHPRGFTLVELLAVLFIIGLGVFIAAGPLKSRSDAERAEQTRTTLAEIRTALLGKELPGEPRTRDDGYIPDVGKLPDQPCGLWTNNDGKDDLLRRTQFLDEAHGLKWGFADQSSPLYVWMGWRGPYISAPKDGVLRDGWGNALIFRKDTPTSGDLTVVSPGANGIESARDTGADSDIAMVVRHSEYTAPVAGVIIPSGVNVPAESDLKTALGNVRVRLYYAAPGPTENHFRVTHLAHMPDVTVAEDGYFLFKDVPVGTDRMLEISQPLPAPNPYNKKALTYLRFEVLPTLNWLGRLDIRNSYEDNTKRW
jgi:prepilin-type N-terminal cleavage/methylation domain-containing protein